MEEEQDRCVSNGQLFGVVEMLAAKLQEQYLLDIGALSPEVDSLKTTLGKDDLTTGRYTKEQAKDVTISIAKCFETTLPVSALQRYQMLLKIQQACVQRVDILATEGLVEANTGLQATWCNPHRSFLVAACKEKIVRNASHCSKDSWERRGSLSTSHVHR